jgi:LynF/TruF/PatF family peptide O-prenyltransferase
MSTPNDYYDDKLKEYFSLSPDHTPVDKQVHALFNTFAKAQPKPYVAECGFKIYDNEVRSARRVQYWFNDTPGNIVPEFWRYKKEFESLGFKFAAEPVAGIIQRLNLGHVSRFIMGYDLRHDIGNSRIEMWFHVNEQPDFINYLLQLYGANEHLTKIIDLNSCFWGIDFNYDGSTKLKIYPIFYTNKFENRAKDGSLIYPKEVLALFDNVTCIYHTYHGINKNHFLHLRFRNPEPFIRHSLNNPFLNNFLSQITFLEPEDVFISVFEKDVVAGGPYRFFNFYY